MFDFGDELTIGSQRIPWLIWIQILVMLLLIILLYHFAIIALGLDPSPDASAASPSAALLSGSSRHRQLSNAAVATANTSRLHSAKLQVGENHSIKDDATSSTRRRGVRGEDIQEREGICYHPCHYFGLAKQAFLKCLGFDPAYKDSPNTNKRKEE